MSLEVGTVSSLAAWKVEELRADLKKRGLSSAGVKAVLIDRLEKAIAEEGGSPDSISPSPKGLDNNSSAPKVEEGEMEGDEEEKTLTVDEGFGVDDTVTMAKRKSEDKKESKNEAPLPSLASKSAAAPSDKNDTKTITEKKEDASEGKKTVSSATAEVIDPEKEKEMAHRSVWVKNLRNGTKAAEIKALFGSVGHVVRAKIFTVKGRAGSGDGSGAGGALGYVTLSSLPECELACLRLNKSAFKGVVIAVTKADPNNLAFLKKPSSSGGAKKDGASSDKKTSTSATRKLMMSDPKKRDGKEEDKKSSSSGNKEGDKSAGTSSSLRKDTTTSSSSHRRPESDKTSTSRHSKTSTSTTTDKKRSSSGNATPTKRDGTKNEKSSSQTSSSGHRYDSSRGAHLNSLKNLVAGSGSSKKVESKMRDDSAEKEKKELAKKLAEKEAEHKKREEELKLQRERERIRYEKEKVEKERLQLKLAELQAHTTSTVPGSKGGGHSSSSSSRHRERDNRYHRE